RALPRDRGAEARAVGCVRLAEPLRWRCAEGHEWTASGTSVKTAGSWCPTCAGVTGPTLAALREHARRRGGRCLATEYRRGQDPLRWRCAQGHEWSAPWVRIRGGQWCPE